MFGSTRDVGVGGDVGEVRVVLETNVFVKTDSERASSLAAFYC